MCGVFLVLYLQYVVSRAVAEVSDADLSAHVPAAEGTGGELQPTDLQQHVRHSRKTVPLQIQILKPVQPTVHREDRQ